MRTGSDLVEGGDGARCRALAEPGEGGGARDGGKEREASEGTHGVRCGTGTGKRKGEEKRRDEVW